MKKRIGQVFSLVLVVTLVIAMAVPVRADVGNAAGYVVGEFWDMMNGKEYDMYFDYWKNFTGYLVGEECPSSPDKYHHGNTPVGGIGIYGSGGTDDNGRFVLHICDYCQKEFKVYASDLQQSYDSQVEELPAQGVTSAGKLLWQPTFEDVSNIEVGWRSSGSSPSYTEAKTSYISPSTNGFTYGFSPKSDARHIGISFRYDVSNLPVSGSYCVTKGHWIAFRGVLQSGVIESINSNGGSPSSFVHFVAEGTFLDCNVGEVDFSSLGRYSFISCSVVFPHFEIISDSTITDFVNTTYNINSRPTSITGNYGIIGDNGQITKVEGNTIVNETNNTVYNPATGETHTLSDWSYNYTDRSYTVTTETGDTITITYGDENVTIKEGDTTYNVYYLVDGSGSENPGPDVPPGCDHTWTETGRTEPTCTAPGKVTSTCSKCSQTKTDTIPATGHTWSIDRTVQITYDEEGNLLQQGYTIYSCTACGEQYKDMEGTGPPGAEGDKSLWEQLGDLIGSGLGGILKLIEAVVGKLLDALTALVTMITDKLSAVVEAVLSIFEEVPAMFGGFLAFLSAIFPFLPPEIMTLLTFGIAAVVFIGIIKAIRR